MRARNRSLMFGFAAAALSAAAVVACGDDTPSNRAGFTEADGAPDVAALPEAAAATDSAAPRDAGFDRGPFDPADEPVTCASATAPCAKEIVAGSNHFCARMNDGTVRCWGDDSYGALGAGSPPKGPKGGGDPDAGDGGDASVDAGVPSAAKVVTGLSGVKQLSAGGSTTCALIDDGSVQCWGRNSFGQLGLSAAKPSFDEDSHDTPTPVAITGTAVRVDVGDASACAVLGTGAVWCWGNDEQAQLARDGVVNPFVLGPGPATLTGITVKNVRPGTTTMLATTATGDVVSWGAVGGKDGVVCGRMSSISPDAVPSALLGLKNVSSLAVSASIYPGEIGESLVATGIGPVPPPGGGPARHAHACAVAGGVVSCWGQSDRGALCTGFPDPELLPAAAPSTSKAWAQQVAVGDEITCARMTDGTIQCCGDDTKGRLGTGAVGLYSALFTPASAFKGHAVQVSASHRAVCALVQGGSVECWGSNAHAELATSEPDDDPHPTPVKVVF